MSLQACLTLALALASVVARADAPLPWGDQGDGTYRNPILPADFSDPDVIRVGRDFYMVASDFHFVGIQVLHSRDLVNWRLVGQVFDRLTMAPKYDAMEAYAQGTWAPVLRHHAGTFYLFVCTPKDGLFLWTATDPAGPWSETVTVKAVEGWEDPCPFWDDDGRAWLVHSKVGAGPLILHRMSPDGRQLLDDGVEIYRGPVAEGPKLFKRNGWYFVSLPEGGVEKGGQTVLRAKALAGPYERRVVLEDGSPHQGALVELENGDAWFVAFKSTGHLGRVTHLLPVRWGQDDWPVFGDEGRTVAGGRKPAAGAGAPVTHPQTSDDFAAPTLAPQWQWNHNPVADAWSLSARAGFLRLQPRPAAELALARNTLTQKLWGPHGVVDVRLDARGLADGQRAGFAFMSGKVFAAIAVVRSAAGWRVSWTDGGADLAEPVVWLRGVYEGEGAQLHWSADGKAWSDTGVRATLKFGAWKGARVALFAYGDGAGHADFDEVRYRHSGPDARP